jgi:hypothetical protein
MRLRYAIPIRVAAVDDAANDPIEFPPETLRLRRSFRFAPARGRLGRVFTIDLVSRTRPILARLEH